MQTQTLTITIIAIQIWIWIQIIIIAIVIVIAITIITILSIILMLTLIWIQIIINIWINYREDTTTCQCMVQPARQPSRGSNWRNNKIKDSIKDNNNKTGRTTIITWIVITTMCSKVDNNKQLMYQHNLIKTNKNHMQTTQMITQILIQIQIIRRVYWAHRANKSQTIEQMNKTQINNKMLGS